MFMEKQKSSFQPLELLLFAGQRLHGGSGPADWISGFCLPSELSVKKGLNARTEETLISFSSSAAFRVEHDISARFSFENYT